MQQVFQVGNIRLPEKPFSDEDEIAPDTGSLVLTPLPKKPFSDIDAYTIGKDSDAICVDIGGTAETWESHKESIADSYSTCMSGTLTTTNPLQTARKHGKLRLLRLRGPTLMLGPLKISAGLLCAWHGKNSPTLNCLGVLLLTIGAMTLAMSLLPSDGRCVPISILLVGLPACSLVALDAWSATDDFQTVLSGSCSLYGQRRPCWLIVVFVVSSVPWVCVYLVAIIVLVRRMKRARATENILRTFWHCISAVCFVSSVVWASRCSVFLASGDYANGSFFALNAIIYFIASCFSLRYTFIVWIQSWLMSRGEAATAAAGISELLGGQDPERVLAVARKSFLSVKADQITKAAMQQNHPDRSLYSLARTTNLGHADAFVSHSWHDDPELKWKELQTWCAGFREMYDREPRLWIDKYCIDQSNIEESLACLPIYLSGCRKLLILCGTTYLKRLWCLMEIFVFLEMGGKRENLEVRLLQPGNLEGFGRRRTRSTLASLSEKVSASLRRASRRHSHGSRTSSITRRSSLDSLATLATELKRFDSLNASCANHDDTIRLQRVIDVIGSTNINMLVSDVFVRKLDL